MKFRHLNSKTISFVVLYSIFYILYSGSASADFLNQTVIFNLNPQYEYLSRTKVSATLRKISSNAYWYVSDDFWAGVFEPEKNLFLEKLDELALEFDNRIYPIERGFWGTESNPGVDNDPKITVLITKLIDQAGGYFDTTHLYKKTEAPESNEREMFFINSSSVISDRAKVFLAHEFQHLIGFYQKEILKNITEDVWLNETRAEYAPRLLGYDDVFDTSNIRRRIFAFQQNQSDPLAEWKNESSDYGAVTLFMYYLVDNYGAQILVDSQKSAKSGIGSINEALRQNLFSQTFSDVFSDWTIANILNDSSVDQKYAYKSGHLSNFRVSPTQSYTISGIGTIFSVSNQSKDWQPHWYEFNTLVGSSTGLNLKVDFSADMETNFRVPFIAFKINGQKEISFLPLNGTSATFFFKNFGSEIYKIVLIPANHSKTSKFTENDPVVSFNLKVQLTSEFEELNASTPLPQISPATSIQDLLDKISALQNQIKQLQKSTISISLTRDLSIGSKGDDVGQLQKFLINQGVYPEARISGYFGPLTKNAVIRFQKKYEIFPQIGYVGPKTRNKILELAD